MQALSQLSYNPKSFSGGGKRDRTADILLAKQVLSQLSYTPFLSGGATRDRTADLLHAMQALSQLSYNPTSESDAHYKKRFFPVNAFLQNIFYRAASLP